LLVGLFIIMTETVSGQYRLLLENLQAGVLIYTPNACIHYANDEVSFLLGISKQALEGCFESEIPWSFIGEDGIPIAKENYPVNRVIKTLSSFKNLIFGIKHPDHHQDTVWVEVNAFPDFDEQGNLNHIIVILYNATEKIRAIDNYRVKRHIFESAKEGILLTEFKTNSAPIFCVNAEFTKICGYTEAEIKGKDISLLCGTYTDEVLMDRVHQKIKEGVSYETTLRFRKKSGNSFWCFLRVAPTQNDNGRITHYVWYFTDVTEQRAINKEVIYNRQVLEQTQKVAKIGYFVLDMHTHSIISSPSFDDILGLNPDLPKTVEHCLGHILPEFQSKIWNRLQEIMQSGGRFTEDFITIRPLDGEQRWISVFAELNHPQDNQSVKLNGVIQDITERKLAEEAAALAQRDLESIISTFPDIVLRFNRDYEFTYCHANNTKDLLLPPEQLVGMSVNEVMPPELVKIIYEKTEEIKKTGKVVSFDYSLPVGSADMEWFEARMINTTKDEIVCVIRNITEQKRAETALRESEQLLRDIFNLAPVPLIISSVEDGSIIMVNEALEKLMGAPLSEFKNYSTLDFYSDSSQRTNIIQQLAQKGHVRNFEVLLKNLHGEETPCLLSSETVMMYGKLTLFSGIVDIKERKKAEEALVLNEQLLSDVFNFSPIALIITQIEDGKIVMANQKAAELAGLDPQTVLGKQVGNFYLNPSDRNLILEGMTQNGKVEGMELALKTKNGQVNYGLVYTSLINLNGERMLFTGFIDNNERKKMDTDLSISLDLVREQNKRLLNFSYIVSHNLRSHTSNIKTILDFLENASSPKEQEEMFAHLRTVTSRLDDTLYDLNEVVSIQKNINLVTEPLPLYEYVERARQVLSEQIHLKKATIYNYIPQDLTVNYNPAYLESILLNLLSNALKYSHPDRLPIIEFKHSQEHQGKTILSISDNGLGIDLVKNKDKIFGMYKTFHGNRDAKGLGLFISKNQVEAIGGTLEVESEPNVGTTFKIHII
jgi:PAS domain S-box-containing protein